MQIQPEAFPYTLDGEISRRRCRNNYGDFVARANPGFFMTKFHKYLCAEIQDFLEANTGKVMDILLLAVPPRHGKSYTVTETLPAWFLGKFPNSNVIIASYETTFSESFSRRNRDKFNIYCPDIFGAGPKADLQSVALWETDNGGKCRAAGLKGGITGHGAELFIIDDPIKNKEAAMSETIITKLHDEMEPSVQSRIHPGGKLIVIQTRWIENDTIGYIEKNWSDFIYKSINLPCECEDEENDPLGRKVGESLMGEHLGDIGLPQKIRNDNKWLKGKKMLVTAAGGEYTWNALYQGHPSAQDGNLFKEGYWKLYDRSSMDFSAFDYTVLSIDATFKQTAVSDMVAFELWCVKGMNLYLWKLINKRMGFVETCNTIRRICKEYPTIDQLLIEDKANGPAIIDVFRYMADVPSIVAINPMGGKFSRAQAVSPYVAAGNVFIPNDFSEAENIEIEWDGQEKLSGHQKFIRQYARFPFMKHDDMVDAGTQAMSRLIKITTGEEPRPARRFIRFNKWYPDMWADYENMNSYEQEQFIHKYGAPLEWEDESYN